MSAVASGFGPSRQSDAEETARRFAPYEPDLLLSKEIDGPYVVVRKGRSSWSFDTLSELNTWADCYLGREAQ